MEKRFVEEVLTWVEAIVVGLPGVVSSQVHPLDQRWTVGNTGQAAIILDPLPTEVLQDILSIPAGTVGAPQLQGFGFDVRILVPIKGMARTLYSFQ